MFTARSRQNAFAKRRREQKAAEEEAETPTPVAVPVDLNPDSEEYTQTPDISTYATGGVVPQTAVEDVVIGEHGPEHLVPLTNISADTQAKIDAVMSHAIPPVAEQPAETPPAEPESDAKRGRGRPRPQETIDRDNAVHALLVGADPETGISKESIAAELQDVKEQQVYSSLRQLTKEGRAANRYVKPHGYRWFAV